MSKYFYHGLKEGCTIFDHMVCIDKMIQILSTGGLKSRRLQGDSSTCGYNGLDYISLCKKEAIEEYCKNSNSSFFQFILNNYCFIISDEVDAIKTKTIDRDQFNDWFEIKAFMDSNPSIRISELIDEWQIKDEIPLKYIVGIGLPFKEIVYFKNISKENEEKINKLYSIAEALSFDIVNTNSIVFVEKYEQEKQKNSKKKVFDMRFMND